MPWFVMTQNPSSKQLVVIEDDDGEVLMFDTEREAEDMAKTQFLCESWGFDVFEY